MKIFLFLTLALFIGTISANRLVKRQISGQSCYNSTGGYLGFCKGGSCVVIQPNLFTCKCPDGSSKLDCTGTASTAAPGVLVTGSPSSNCPTACING